jgi:hypothetical protein
MSRPRRADLEELARVAFLAGRIEESVAIGRRALYTCECGAPAERQADRYGIYAGSLCDSCFDRAYASRWTFEPLDAGESLEAIE